MPLFTLYHLWMLLGDRQRICQDLGIPATHFESNKSRNQLLSVQLGGRHRKVLLERGMAPTLVLLLVVFQQKNIVRYNGIPERFRSVCKDLLLIKIML